MTDTAAALLGDNGTLLPRPLVCNPPRNRVPTRSGPPHSTRTRTPTSATRVEGTLGPADVVPQPGEVRRGAKNLLELPPEDASPEALEAFYTKLGRPANPDDYGFKVPRAAVPEMVEWFKTAAHKHGLNTKQAQSLFNEFNGMSGSMQENFKPKWRRNPKKPSVHQTGVGSSL